jgi:hypothetical protein
MLSTIAIRRRRASSVPAPPAELQPLTFNVPVQFALR